jgi:type I restriction enzyme S subunit
MIASKSFSELFDFQKKSKIKAGDGLKNNSGKFPFYTSSNELTKSINEYLYEKPSLILGTGGLASIHYSNEKFAVSTDCLVASPKSEDTVYPKFVFHYLSGNIHLLKNGFKGAGLKHISKGYISDLKIPLPILETQKRIAQILDDAAALRIKTEQLLKEYDLLAQSIFLDMFGDPVTNPKGWDITSFSKVLSKIESGWSPVCENMSRISEKEWAVLKLGAVSYQTYNPNENKRYESDVPKTKQNCEVKKGDLLFTRKNSSHLVGATSFVYETSQKLLLPDTVFRLLYRREIVNPLFLYYLLNHPKFSKEIQLLATGSSGSMPNISKAKLLAKEIILPNSKLQNQFAEKISLIEKQKELVKHELKESEDLFNCLLQKAFKGELV